MRAPWESRCGKAGCGRRSCANRRPPRSPDEIAREFSLGALRQIAQLEPRYACRCSRERVARALRSLGAPELREMAEKDGGAALTCDFCNAAYQFPAEELLALAQG